MKYQEFIHKIITFQSKSLLGFISFIESIFFPIPTDVLLIPMSISKPSNWYSLAMLATIMSVLGGIVGYFLGYYLFNEISPYIFEYGYKEEFLKTQSLFIEYGVIILFISSFTPLPYKIFVIVSGFLSVNLFLFIIISFIGRGMRFFSVSFISKKYGNEIFHFINHYFLYISAFVILVFVIYKLYN